MLDIERTLDIPSFLKRDADNRAEFHMNDDSVSEVESRPAETKPKTRKAKSNGHDEAPVKATGKVKAKGAGKAPIKAKTAPKAAIKAAKGLKAVGKAKTAKPKREVTEKDAYGFRKGSAKSKAVAMYARKNGATLAEVKAAVGSVQLNVLNSMEADGAKIERVKEEKKGHRPVTRYILKSV
jgi:hypothetical protein